MSTVPVIIPVPMSWSLTTEGNTNTIQPRSYGAVVYSCGQLDANFTTNAAPTVLQLYTM